MILILVILCLKLTMIRGKTELEKKSRHVTDFVKKEKLTELENKTPDIRNLATKTALTTVENLMLLI